MGRGVGREGSFGLFFIGFGVFFVKVVSFGGAWLSREGFGSREVFFFVIFLFRAAFIWTSKMFSYWWRLSRVYSDVWFCSRLVYTVIFS